MAEQTVRVRGYRECVAALGKVNRGVAKTARDALRDVARPVSETAKNKLARYPGASLGTIGPKVTTKGVFVTQRAKKVTGLRPDFGHLQQTKGLEPALDEHADDIEDSVTQAFDRLVDSAGFH